MAELPKLLEKDAAGGLPPLLPDSDPPPEGEPDNLIADLDRLEGETDEAKSNLEIAELVFEELKGENTPESASGAAEAPTDFSPELLSQARSFGFTSDVIEGMTPASLEYACLAMQAMMNEQSGDVEIPPEQVPAPKTEEPMQDGGFEKLDLGERLDDFDDETREVLEMLTNAVNDERAARHRLEQNSRDAQQTNYEATAASYSQQFDAAIASFGEEYVSLFGEGDHGSLEPGSEAYTNRTTVLEEAAAIQRGHDIQKLPPLPFPELVKRAVGSLFGDKALKTARKQIGKQVARRGSQRIGTPSSRRQVKVRGANEAQQAAIEKAIELGYDMPNLIDLNSEDPFEGFR